MREAWNLLLWRHLGTPMSNSGRLLAKIMMIMLKLDLCPANGNRTPIEKTFSNREYTVLKEHEK